jgi:hypothetical protein
MHRSLAVLLCALAVGCRSAEKLEARPLPVHVAIVPIGAPTVGQVTPGEFEGTETELRLELEGDEVTRAVAEALEEYCFARTTLLELDEEEGPVDAFERERMLLELARERGADWILELALRYDPEIYRENTSTFWLNYPLFLFAGPSNWFIPDVAYYADVELTARAYDMHAIGALDGGLGDPVAEVIRLSSRFAGTELTFNERSDGAGDYAKGILIPSGHLARESEDTADEVKQDVLEALQVQLVQSIQSRRDELVRTDGIAPVFIVPDEVRIERQGGELRVAGRVLLRDDGFAGDVRAVHLDAGTGRVSVAPARVTEGCPEGYAAFQFDVPLAAAADAGFLRLECEAGARDKYVRSYTFRLPQAATVGEPK